MKNICLKCGKTKEVNESGYCINCYNKVFKQSNKTTSEQRKIATIRNRIIVTSLIIVVVLFLVFCQGTVKDLVDIAIDGSWDFSEVSFRVSIPSFIPVTENIILNEDNMGETIKKYASKHKNNDDLYYFLEAYITYGVANAFSAAFNGNTDELYANIYGKTIKQLSEEGRKLAKENNISIEEIKKGIEKLNLEF